MKFSRSKQRRTLLAYAFLLPTLLVLGLFQFFPMAQAFYLAFWDYFPGSPNNEFIGLENFQRLLTDEAFHLALKNSILYLVAVPVIIVLSLGLAMLVEPQIPFMDFFRAAFYIPVVTMMVVVAYMWRVILNTDTGVLNIALVNFGILESGIPFLTSEHMALWSVMSVTIWKGLGYYMVIFIVALRAVPKELEEAAVIDGANPIQSFRAVTLPSIWPTVSLVAIISSIGALKVFEEIYVMTGGRIDTATLVYEIYEVGFDMSAGGGLEMGYACAMGLVLFALIFVFSAFSIKVMERAYDS